MKGDKVFLVGVVMAFGGLIGIVVGFLLHLVFPALGTWIALICFVAVCVSIIPLLIALGISAFDLLT